LGSREAAAASYRAGAGGVDHRKPGYPHDVRVKVSLLRSGRGSWLDAASVAVRPVCQEIVPSGRQPQLPTGELALVCRWIDLNRPVILEFWDGVISFDEVAPRLQKLP
jgi:hypothetical protein